MSSEVQAKWMNSTPRAAQAPPPLFLQEILDRFHVVVGGALDGFDALSVFFIEFRDDFVEESVCVGVKSGTSLISAQAASFAANVLQPVRGISADRIR